MLLGILRFLLHITQTIWPINMLVPVYRPRGLNLRQNVIERPFNSCQDVRNLEYTSRGELDLRWGYEQVLTDSDIIDLFEYVGSPDDPNRGSLYALKSDGLYKLESGSLVAVPEGNVSGQPTWTAQTKPVEYNKVLYWNDPDGVADLWKFDGYSSYRAGVPAPKINSSVFGGGAAGTYYYRVILKYTDPQGNITYSDSEPIEGTNSNAQFTFAPITDSYYSGFYQKLANSTTALGNNLPKGADLSIAANRTATLTTNNLLPGDALLVQKADLFSGPFTFQGYGILIVESVSGTDVTFTESSFEDGVTYILSSSSMETGGSAEPRYQILIYRSQNRFSNYQKMVLTGSQGYELGGSNVAFVLDASSLTSPAENLESVYDDSLVRVLPPKGKYLALYNEQMFIGNLNKDQNDFGYAELLGNDTRLEDSIVWSDIPTLSNGSSVETFLVNNIRSIGQSSDGAIRGIEGNDDNFVVHKERQSYYINGDFITNSLRVRRAMAEKNGVPSHRSIVSVDGGHIYCTDRGIYFAANGAKPVELSDIIEPFFTEDALSIGTMDFANAKTINDFRREKIYIFIPVSGGNGVVLVYDYYYKEWFLHDNIPGSNGFQDVGIESSEVYFADGSALYRRVLNTKTDNGTGITGYYWTNWLNLDAPSLLKKYQNFILMAITRAWTATIKAYCNWKTATPESQNTLEFTSDQQVMDTQVFQNEAYSVSYRISNESDQSDMLITGFEAQLEPTQTLPKGDL